MTTSKSSRPALRPAVIAAASLGFAVVQLDVSVVNVAIRSIGTSLGGGVSALQWVVGAYTITFASLILSAGALGDRLGARRLYLAGLAIFTLASMACAAAPSLGILIAARAAQGVGAAILVPCSLALIRHAHPDARVRGRAVGWWAAGASVALSGGPLVGGLLIAAVGWRAIFFINLPIGLATAGLTVRSTDETPRSAPRRLDLPGQLTATLALALLAAGIIEAGTAGFAVWYVLAPLVLGGAAGAGFVLLERRQGDPLLPPALFARRPFRTSAIIGVLINIAFYGLVFVLSLFFQRVQRRSPLGAGLAFVPMTAVVMLANLLSGRRAGARSTRPLLVAGALLLAAGSLGLIAVEPGTRYAALVLPLAAIGAGIGLIVPAITSAMLGSVEPARAGLASGTLNTARQTGSLLGVAIFGSLAATRITPGLHTALGLSALLALAVLALGATADRAG